MNRSIQPLNLQLVKDAKTVMALRNEIKEREDKIKQYQLLYSQEEKPPNSYLNILDSTRIKTKHYEKIRESFVHKKHKFHDFMKKQEQTMKSMPSRYKYNKTINL